MAKPFARGLNALNKLVEALNLPEDCTGFELAVTVDDVPKLTTYRLVDDDEVDELGRCLVEHFTLNVNDDDEQPPDIAD